MQTRGPASIADEPVQREPDPLDRRDDPLPGMRERGSHRILPGARRPAALRLGHLGRRCAVREVRGGGKKGTQVVHAAPHSALYVAKDLDSWAPSDPGLLANEITVNGKAFRRLDRDYRAWLESKLDRARNSLRPRGASSLRDARTREPVDSRAGLAGEEETSRGRTAFTPEGRPLR